MKVTTWFLSSSPLGENDVVANILILQPSLVSDVFVSLYLGIALRWSFDILWNNIIYFLAESHIYTHNMKLSLGFYHINLGHHKDSKSW